MVKLLTERLLGLGFSCLNKMDYEKSIRLFSRILKSEKSREIRMRAYIGLGDALRYEYEMELAEKIYKKAINLAEILEDTKIIKLLEKKIEYIYVFKKERNLNAIQIGFFMRSIMRLLSFLGKKDWF